MDGSWLRGQVFVTLKNNIFEASEANKTLAEIMECLSDCKPNVWLHADGGGEHHVGHPSVIAAAICFFRNMHDRVDRLIKTRGCPYHSYLHEVERVMSILNLGLYGVAMERPRIDHDRYPGMEEKFVSSKTTADLRAAGRRFPQLVEGLDHALDPLYDMLYERFEQLDLKGKQILRGSKVSSTRADVFFDAIKVRSTMVLYSPALSHRHHATTITNTTICVSLQEFLEGEDQTMVRGDLKRKHLKSPLLHEFMEGHCILDPYKLEVYKGCWHSQLCSLKAANHGQLPQDKVNSLYANFKCKFGCPPPKTPASVFVGMYEVPRPKKMPGVAKYDTFEETYGKPTPVDLPPLKPGATHAIAPPGVIEKEKAQGMIKCTSCQRPRCIYVKMKLSATSNGAPPGCTLKDVLGQAIEANISTYTCGSDLDLRGFESLSGVCRPYVRMKLDCSQHVELQVYSSSVLPKAMKDKICAYCGEEGSYRQAENEASPTLPVCDPCFLQHKKARPSGRQLTRFDRSNMREAHAQAVDRRDVQVQRSTNQFPQPLPPAKRQRPQQEEEPRVPAARGMQHANGEASASNDTPTAPQFSSNHSNSAHNSEMSSNDASDSDGHSSEQDAGDEPDYYVQAIHNVRFANRRLEYFIEWQGFPAEEHHTWEPAHNLPNDKDKIRVFKETWLAEGKMWPTNMVGGRS